MIKRKAYSFIKKAIKENKIPIIIGMRRIGKTTMLEQYKQENKKSQIITWDYFAFQAMKELDFFSYIESLCSKGGTLLFDEVQVRPNWDIFIKNMYDKYVSKNICRIIVTGSSSMILAGKDLGVTRTEKIFVDTWDFDEYCNLTKSENSLACFEKFLGYGFPEFMKDKPNFSRMLNTTLKPILEDDIPKAYPGINTLGLMRFIKSLSSLTNGEVNETSLSLKAKISIPTVRKYIDILEKALLIKRVYRINSDGRRTKKNQYKVYLNPHIHIWLLNRRFDKLPNESKGHIIESYWLHWTKGINEFNHDFFYIKDSNSKKEIDFVSVASDGEFNTIHEFKYRNQINISSLYEFIKLKAKNKIIWCKETKEENGIKFLSILDINSNWNI